MTSVRKTKKAKVETRSDGSKAYGPYEGSAKNKGRPVTVYAKKGEAGSSSSTTARHEKKKTTTVPKDKDVAHKPGTGRKATSASSTTVQSKKKNIGDGNKTRSSRGSNQHRKKRR